ncbi:hypothetical protein K493DRAFT_319400 [Basidiobolus meristosporus CBS 931.73]|uniref:Arrestin C-terminal-like domain-containing protein n=1 Tax=Basidiobolus meristosporus CBS 931.73 TaxID=1314790 RepID=A0A1Y1XS00_9FUNG|nr:hypothetical protein K493DRAFT_319400 [Basidiobolus meristosporus CBS 931.73]|eukprot:ORX88517.1 hypothetical protein K493DRAFT_319400 [Basidiobolus meristosporus CBS 931.73]
MKVCWDEVPGLKHHSRLETRPLLNYSWRFFESTKKSGVLEAGEYEYPFQIGVPGNLPETVCTEYGQIKYKLKGILTRPTFCANYLIEKEIPIQRFLAPSLRLYEPVTITETWKGKLAYEVYISSKTFGPSESIDIILHVLRMAPEIQLKKISCLLKEYTYYRFPGKSRNKLQTRWVTRNTITTFHVDESNEQCPSWEGIVPLEVPPFGKVHSDCRTEWIQVRHKLKCKIEFQLNDSTKAVYVCLPIMISSGSSQQLLTSLPRYEELSADVVLCPIAYNPPTYDTLYSRGIQ